MRGVASHETLVHIGQHGVRAASRTLLREPCSKPHGSGDPLPAASQPAGLLIGHLPVCEAVDGGGGLGLQLPGDVQLPVVQHFETRREVGPILGYHGEGPVACGELG